MKLIEKGPVAPSDVPRQFFTFVANAENVRRYDIALGQLRLPFFFDSEKDITAKEALRYLSLLITVPENWVVLDRIESGGSWNPLFNTTLQIMDFYGGDGLKTFYNDVDAFIEVVEGG